jgi:hypothetical protein
MALFRALVGGGSLGRTSARTSCVRSSSAEIGAEIVASSAATAATRPSRRRVRDRADGQSRQITPHSEAFQAVVWHLLVSHPALKAAQTKWESTATFAAPCSSTETA